MEVNNEWFDFIINNNPDFIFSIDKSGCFTNVNNTLCVALNLTAAEIVGKSFTAVGFSEKTTKHLATLIDKVSVTNTGLEEIIPDLFSEKNLNSYKIILQPLNNKAGNNIGIAGIAREIKTQSGLTDIQHEKTNEFYSVIENAPDLIGIHTQGKFVFINKAGIKLLKAKSEDDIIGKPVAQFVHHEYLDTVKNRIERIEKHQTIADSIEEKLVCVDGSLIDVEVKGIPIKFEKKNSVLVVARDISERKKVREMIQLERKMLRAVIDNIPDSIYVKDIQGRKLIANPQDVKYMGVASEEEAIGKSDDDVYSKNNAENFNTDDRYVFDNGKPILNKTEFFVDKQNQEHWLLTSKVPLRNEKNEIIGLVGIGRDVTERQKMLEQLFENQERLNKIILSTKDLVFEVDADAKISYCSEAAETILGYKPKELTGKIFFDFVADDEKQRTLQYFEESVKNGLNIIDFEYWVKHKDGHKVCLLVNAYPQFDKSGNLKGYIGVDKDITERKKIEIKLKELNQQLDTLIESIPDAIFFKDGSGRWLIINESAKKLFGLQNFEWYGKTDKELQDGRPDYALAHESCILSDEKAWQGGKLCVCEEIIADENSVEHYFEVTKVPLFETDGKRKGLVIVSKDVTVLRKSKQKLEDSVEQLQTLIELIPYKVILKDGKGRWLVINELAKKRFNLDGIDWFEKIDEELGFLQQPLHPDLAELHKMVIEQDEQAWAEKKPFTFEAYGNNLDNTNYIYEITKVPLFESNGNRKALLTVINDITKQKEEEQYLKLLETAITHTTDAIVITKANTIELPGPTIIFVNDAYLKMTGYKREDVLGKNPRILQGINTDRNELDRLRNALENNKPCKVELINYRKNGEEFWSAITISPLVNNDGVTTHWIAVKRDITENKKYDQNIKKATIQAQENEKFYIGRELHDNIAQILVGSLFSLSTVKGHTDKDSARLKDAIEDVRNSIDEIRNLSHQLAPSKFKSDNFILAVRQLIKSINKANSFKIITHFDKIDDANLDSDRQLNLYRILQEQLQNIIKHADASEIEISMRFNDMLELRIFDNGKGFDPKSKTNGIGLQNIRNRAEIYGGYCEIKSSYAGGCELMVKLPIT